MSTALLAMDFQRGVVMRYPSEPGRALLWRLQAALSAARTSGIPVIYVRLAFDADALPISSRNRLFSPIAGDRAFAGGDSGTQIHPQVRPEPGDFVVTKKRASAFCGSGLAALILSLGVTDLVLCGLSTSGVVLSTVRDAADRDLGLTVLSDACADRDDEVHRVLCEKVFPMQAEVCSVSQWVATLAPTSR